jgi:hypothetical protein
MSVEMDANSQYTSYASVGIRLKAFLLDYIPIAAYITLPFGITVVLPG